MNFEIDYFFLSLDKQKKKKKLHTPIDYFTDYFNPSLYIYIYIYIYMRVCVCEREREREREREKGSERGVLVWD